ncbi:AAEL002908-PA [Aedes aegypti]|uniref:AAEL002908-PA n=2 Tax=Aedes aegypti TaxID=7159 RepID=A0A1S4F328_AEDAE|nr:uncharacterized protein LOC5576463 [Aedes aegypti]EAT45840.1 AAEL002908-PA [Aedes aegypti]
MKFILEVTFLVALGSVCTAQFNPWFEETESSVALRRPRPPFTAGSPPPAGVSVPTRKPPTALATQAQEQRVVSFQNRSLERLFQRSFTVDTPVEFQDAVVHLYVRSQRELDLCAEFLWETHLLKEYRRCASVTQRAIWRQVQILKEDIRALTLADYEYGDY